jgi:protein-S-isoprenylcysteine O-methyltransferase Ste14
MIDYLKKKKKYLKEPWRLRVNLAYFLMIVFAVSARPIEPYFWIGTAMVAAGVIIRAWASGIIKKDDELATEGPYSLCRNPLYVGNFLIGYGICAINTHWWNFGLLTAYFLLIYPFTIRKEERKLNRLFQEDFAAYKEKVRRFIPRLTPYKTLFGWSPYQYFVDNMDFLNEGAVIILWAYTFYIFIH